MPSRSRFLAVLPVLCLLASIIHAQEWKKAYAVTGKPNVTLEADDSHVRVRACKCKEVRVLFTGDKLDLNKYVIRETQSGNDVSISIREKHRVHMAFHIGINIVHIPHIEVEAPQQSDLTLQTGDGSLEVADVHGALNLKSGDGHVDVMDADGTLKAVTSDGPVRIDGRFDLLDVKTGDGSVEVHVEPGSQVSTDWRIHTGDGRVTLHVPASLKASFDVTTGDGHIQSDLPITAENFDSRHHGLRGKMNGGAGYFNIHTGDGSIRLTTTMM